MLDVVWAILLLTSNVSSETLVCHCNVSHKLCDWWEVNQLGQMLQFQQHLFRAFFFSQMMTHAVHYDASIIPSPSLLNIWRLGGVDSPLSDNLYRENKAYKLKRSIPRVSYSCPQRLSFLLITWSYCRVVLRINGGCTSPPANQNFILGVILVISKYFAVSDWLQSRS